MQLNNAEYVAANASVEGLGGIQTFPVIAKDYGVLKLNKLPGGFHGTQKIDESGCSDSFVFGRIASEEVS